ncbi:MAG: YhfC family intramembrane metalloprotease [Anaerolineales bacterium]|nr:YhfC family intramembrane metalloprotease [Anaerolineales bacterium]
MDEFIRMLNGVLMIVLPVVLGILLARRYKTTWSVFFAGSVTFILSQVGHLPFNQMLLSPLALASGWVRPDGRVTLTGAILYGLSAGVFEEMARYLVLRFWRKDVRTWERGMMFGAGHGGIEGVVLGGLALMGFAQAMAMRGVTDLTQAVAPDQVEILQASLESYWSLPWYAVLLGAGERVLALILHLSLSLMVVLVFRRNNPGWLALAVFWHALADALVVFVASTAGTYTAEAVLVLVAVASIGWIILFRHWLPRKDPPGPEPAPALLSLQKVETRVDQASLDESKYH